MELKTRFITLTSTVETLNAEGNTASFQAGSNFTILGGSLRVYDAAGAVLPTTQHDEITIDLKVDDTNLNPQNLTMTAFALNEILQRESFPAFQLDATKTIFFRAKHTTPASGANEAVPIKTSLILLAVKN